MFPSARFSGCARYVLIAAAFGVLAAACGSDGETADSASGGTGDSSSNSITSTVESSSSTSSTSSTMATTTTSPFGDTIDLQGAPPLLFASNSMAYYFADLLDEPEIRIGPLESGNNYLVSPDGTMLAVGTAGDAVRAARVEIIDIESGKAVQTIEIDSDTVSIEEWSPDSTAVVVYSDEDPISLDVDGTTQTLEAAQGRYRVWVGTPDGTQVVYCRECAQVWTSDGEPLAIGYLDGAAGLLTPGSSAVEPFGGVWGSARISALSCLGVSTVNATIDGETKTALYDVDAKKLIDIETVTGTGICPVVSNDGKSVAVAQTEGGTMVVDLESGESVDVARQGIPMAWSSDDSLVAVKGNGTFLVNPDGSGGNEASLDIRSFCPIGSSGHLLAETEPSRELVVFDVGSDSANSVGSGSLRGLCQFTEDFEWAVVEQLVIDLENLELTHLNRRNEDGLSIGGTRSIVGLGYGVQTNMPRG